MTEIVSLADVTERSLPAAMHGGAVSIGNFDGVHQGHTSLLGQVKSLANTVGGPAVACLFDPHPIAILRPELAPKQLTTIEERARRMRPLGIDYLVVCETSQQLLDLTAEAFFHGLLQVNLNSRGLIEGENFRFGKSRAGDVRLLGRLCDESEMMFRIATMETNHGNVISSTRIRDHLSEGDVRSAADLMGYPHRVTGQVVRGDQRGRTIGFPTANLSGINVLLPASGVYAAHAIIGQDRFDAAVHIGPSPTFDSGDETKVEAHLLDFEGDLYQQRLTLEFEDRIRPAKRFESSKQLVAQLHQDVALVTQLLRREPPKEI